MPEETVRSVEYNHEGEYKFAFITKQGEGGPRNYNLLVNVQGGELEPFPNVPQGTESGTWR